MLLMSQSGRLTSSSTDDDRICSILDLIIQKFFQLRIITSPFAFIGVTIATPAPVKIDISSPPAIFFFDINEKKRGVPVYASPDSYYLS